MKQRNDGRYVKVKIINGKRVTFYSRESTERRALKDIERQMLEYTEKSERGKTFAEVADEWEEKHYTNLQWQTIARYKSLVAHLVNYFGDEYIKQITRKDVDTFFARLVCEHFSSKSLKDQMSITKMIFRYALINEYVDNNITEYLITPKGAPAHRRQSLTDNEIRVICNNTDKDFGNLAYFLLYTGLRKGEALALTYGDLDFENSVIHITKSLEHHNNRPFIKCPKTDAGYRDIPLLDNLRPLFSERKSKNDLIFSQHGKHMSKSYFDTHWKNYCDAGGLKITAHQLRHTFATLLFEWGIDVKDSQELLGHTDIATTRNIYTHIRQNRLSDTAAKINAMIVNPAR